MHTAYRRLEKLVDEGIINKYIIDPGSPACFEYVGEDSHQDSDVCFHDTYCRKTDTPKQYIQAWTPIVAASQSVKAIEDEREFLKKWVNVVDYV